MASIEISEELERKLLAVAQEAGKSRDDLAQEILGHGLEELHGSNIIHTPEFIEHMKLSLAQLDRGEYISGEEIDAKLDRWLEEIEARER